MWRQAARRDCHCTGLLLIFCLETPKAPSAEQKGCPAFFVRRQGVIAPRRNPEAWCGHIYPGTSWSDTQQNVFFPKVLICILLPPFPCSLFLRRFFGLSTKTSLTSGSFRFGPKHRFRVQLPQILVIDGHTLIVHGGASRQKYSPVRKKHHGMPIPVHQNNLRY